MGQLGGGMGDGGEDSKAVGCQAWSAPGSRQREEDADLSGSICSCAVKTGGAVTGRASRGPSFGMRHYLLQARPGALLRRPVTRVCIRTRGAHTSGQHTSSGTFISNW